MKIQVLAGVLAWMVMAGTGVSGQADLPETDKPAARVRVEKQSDFKDRMSYALGYDVFSHISVQVDLDMDEFVKGVTDAQKGTPQLDPEQMKEMLAAYQRLARKSAADKFQTMRTANLSRGNIFLEGNKLKEGVVVLSSGLQYRVITAGEGPVPGKDDSVECHYRGRLLDGTEFDSSYARGRPAVFQVARVIQGWTQALTRMPVGSKWELFIPPELAYGDEGAGDKIQPGQTLIFEVELLGILDPP